MVPGSNRFPFGSGATPTSLAAFAAVAAVASAAAYAVSGSGKATDSNKTDAVDSSKEKTTAISTKKPLIVGSPPYAAEQSMARRYAGVYSSVPPTDPALCPKYGCPLLPRDIAFDTAAKDALRALQAVRAAAASADAGAEAAPDDGEVDALDELRSAGDDNQATLTLLGYKGGKLDDQINQDRAFVLSPYRVALPSKLLERSSADENPQDADKASCQGSVGKVRLLGVFDGHGAGGEFVSDHVVTNLPRVLAAKLEQVATPKGDGGDEVGAEDDAVKLALVETFLEVDRTAPPSHASNGGCTATVVLQLGKHVYVANAGDSRSFIATHKRSTGEVKVIYKSREDFPDLPDENIRIERMGGHVRLAEQGGSSRVIYTKSGLQYGLAMSRSLGDWDAGKVGVIPDPIVDVINLEDAVVGSEAAKEGSCTAECAEEGGGIAAAGDTGDVEVFAVSVCDGFTDFMSVEYIAKNVATSLYVEDSLHPLAACGSLIGVAAGKWHKARKGVYRDDITIAVSKLDF